MVELVKSCLNFKKKIQLAEVMMNRFFQEEGLDMLFMRERTEAP